MASYFAGYADVMTRGYSTQFNNSVWGSIAQQNAQGALFAAGQITGTVVQIAGAFVGCGGGLLLTTVRLYNNATVVVGGVQAAQNIYTTGQVSLGDGLALAGMLGWAGGNLFGSGCFEAGTLLADGEAVELATAELTAGNGHSKLYCVLAVGTSLVRPSHGARLRRRQDAEDEEAPRVDFLFGGETEVPLSLSTGSVAGDSAELSASASDAVWEHALPAKLSPPPPAPSLTRRTRRTQ